MTSTFHSRVNWAHHLPQQDKMNTVQPTQGKINSVSHNTSKWAGEDSVSLKRKVVSFKFTAKHLNHFSLCWTSSTGDMASLTTWLQHHHASPAYAHGLGPLHPLPHLVTEHSQSHGAKDFPCLFTTEKERRPLCKLLRWDVDSHSVSILRNNSCITEKQNFWKFISLPKRKGACLYFQIHIQCRVRKLSCRPKFKVKIILLSLTGLQRNYFRKNWKYICQQE